MPEFKLSEQDKVDILEEIAKDGGNAAARIAAIKALNEMGRDVPAGSGFDDLDGPNDPVARRAQMKAA